MILHDIRQGAPLPPTLKEMDSGEPVHPVRLLSLEDGQLARGSDGSGPGLSGKMPRTVEGP